MEPSTDYLSLASNKEITKLFEPGEQILFSYTVYKFNPLNWKQERSLLITNKNLYNLKSNSLKRRISLINVAATTVSEDKDSKEFIIHVPDEYDYRYTSEK